MSTKLVVLGESGVGKTCCLISYRLNEFPSDYIPTVYDVYNHSVEVDGEVKSLDLWDTAGHVEYNGLRSLCYHGTNVFLVMFSHASPDSFDAVKSRWLPEINSQCPGVPFVLVGNKNDLILDSSTIASLQSKGLSPITEAQAQQTALEINAHSYVSCSALTQEGLRKVFETAVRAAASYTPSDYKSEVESSSNEDDAKTPFILPKFKIGPNTEEEELVQYLKGLIPNPNQKDICVDVSGRAFRSNIGVSIGQFSDAVSSINVKYKTGSDAHDIVSSLNLTNEATPLVVSVSFNVKEGTSAFRLGELSGTIRDILGLGLSKYKGKIMPKYNTDYDEGRHLYTISFSINSAATHDAIQDIIKFYQPHKINASVDFSQSPSQFARSSSSSSSPPPVDEFIQARATLETDSARNVFRLLEGSLISKNDKEKDQRIMGIFRSGKSVSFKLEFDDVAEFYKFAMYEEVPPFLKTLNWKTLQDSSVMVVEKLMGKKIPEQLREAYTKVTEFLTGLNAIYVVLGKENVVELSTHNLGLFMLLPNLQEMIAEKKRKKEEKKNGRKLSF